MESSIDTPTRPVSAAFTFEARIAAVGHELTAALASVLNALPAGSRGSAELARTLGVDKVLTSRVAKATRTKDPLAALYVIPGPEPLRRLLRAASKRDISPDLIETAVSAVEQFDALIRREAGDRSALNAMISAWLPDVRAEFELRRKQTAFRAMSELKGAAVNLNLATVLLHPSRDGEHLDVVWLFGLLGLRRLRPGSTVKFATRRMAKEPTPRRPCTLAGVPVEGLEGLRLDEFCSVPAAGLDVHHVGEIVHYTLADNGFGPRSASDLVFAEANLAELARYVPPEQRRKRHLFAEVMTPSKVLLFDALLYEDVLFGVEPALFIYDTAFDGIADVNDPARNIDRMDLCESIQPLGRGISKFRTAEVPRYAELLRHVCTKLDWDGQRFRGYRCRIDYPIYGTQVSMAFDSPPAPSVP